uniref:Uncharacterized protein n=1 Tax=Glossina palpalis gambiensis TaxID=67801 RepID=A0A1B0C371_9MUSC
MGAGRRLVPSRSIYQNLRSVTCRNETVQVTRRRPQKCLSQQLFNIIANSLVIAGNIVASIVTATITILSATTGALALGIHLAPEEHQTLLRSEPEHPVSLLDNDNRTLLNKHSSMHLCMRTHTIHNDLIYVEPKQFNYLCFRKEIFSLKYRSNEPLSFYERVDRVKLYGAFLNRHTLLLASSSRRPLTHQVAQPAIAEPLKLKTPHGKFT